MDTQGHFGCRGVASVDKIARHNHLRTPPWFWTLEPMPIRLVALVAFVGCASALVPGLPDRSSEASRLLASLPPGGLSVRTEAASRALLGRGYLLGPLGEGDAALRPGSGQVRGEAKPRFRLDSFDCVTYLETSMALAAARDTSDLLSRMDSIRYRGGMVDWRWRNHFFEGDWLPRNASRVALVRFADDTTVVRRLARKGFFAKKGLDIPDTSVDLHLLWRDRAIAHYSKASDSTRLRGVALV